MDRFPHSEILGSIPICKSPKLIAAYHVLLRLWEPRHPPCTLSYFLLRYRLLLGIVCLYFRSVICYLFSVFSFPSCDRSLIPVNCSPTTPICCLLFNLTSSNMSKNFRLRSKVKAERLKVFTSLLLPLSFYLNWWRITDSNRWPPACKAGALASWANPPIRCAESFNGQRLKVFYLSPFTFLPFCLL